MNQHSALEKIGRAGLKTVRFDTGVGGIPEYTQMDFAHALTGLSKEATAWAMYAYSNTEDEKSLSFLTSRLAKIIARKFPELPPKSIVGLVKVTLRECLMYAPEDTKRKGCSVTLRCTVMNISRDTYYRKSTIIRSAVDMVMQVIRCWEKQIGERVGDKLTYS
ncbi:hypothetical protein [Vibrio diazotrophicus]|uniref:hypothetical protein n=1 Tax=Vibrio diazotrophicus TaxID=685 RepID=UPI00142E5A80|nr:hypothetical protein [Vibrio diazotrophicus]NIY91132.1 hypothetical protein [Vibrio diazotrophicus]